MKKILLTLTALSVFTNYIGDASATENLINEQKEMYGLDQSTKDLLVLGKRVEDFDLKIIELIDRVLSCKDLDLGDDPDAAKEELAKMREDLVTQHKEDLSEPAFIPGVPGTLSYELATSNFENRLKIIAMLKRHLSDLKVTNTTTFDNFSRWLKINGITDNNIQNCIWTAITKGKIFTKFGTTIGSMDDFEEKVAAALYFCN